MNVELTLSDQQVEEIAHRAAELIAEPEQDGPEPWIGVPEAAKHLGCSTGRIYRLVEARRIPHEREGRRLCFRRSALDAFVREGSR